MGTETLVDHSDVNRPCTFRFFALFRRTNWPGSLCLYAVLISLNRFMVESLAVNRSDYHFLDIRIVQELQTQSIKTGHSFQVLCVICGVKHHLTIQGSDDPTV
jgi:hypothetical protein